MSRAPEPMSPAQAEVDAVAGAAGAAFDRSVSSTGPERAAWLRSIAEALEAAAGELIGIADRETHLGATRLTGELHRTTGQLRQFAEGIVEGSYLEATIDHGDPTAVPPRPDLRRMLRPLGPVAVFSASNFPFAFSVAGGDTASALAAGCSVVVKGHSAHPVLSRATAEVVVDALTRTGAPDGLFGLVQGRDAGVALVQHPEIRAVGFTGSVEGGRRLFDLAHGRPDPIPFYGELGSVNPVILTAAALSSGADELAAGLAASFTLGVGQFCTSPGLVLVPAGSDFAQRVADRVASLPAAPMLTLGIADAFRARIELLRRHPAVSVVAGGHVTPRGEAGPVVLATTAMAVRADPGEIAQECFGPSTLIVEYSAIDDALSAIESVGGSLTATVHAAPGEDLASILPILTRLAGRIVFDGWPTGVTVGWAQHHGGPWPASTTLHTSVGMTAIRRFVRPIAYQNAPDAALPAELRESDPLGIVRRVDGVLHVPGAGA